MKERVIMVARYRVGERVLFNIGQDLCTGEAVISACEIDIDDEDNFFYRLETDAEGTNNHRRRGKSSELWVNEFEVNVHPDNIGKQ